MVCPKRSRALRTSVCALLRGSHRLALLLLVSLFAVVTPAAAGDRQVIEVGGVVCGASYSGPRALTHGYFAVRVDLHNTTNKPRIVRFEAEQQWGAEDFISKRVQLGPGESLSFEPLMRASYGGTSVYTLTFSTGGKRGQLGIGPPDYANADELCVLYASRAALEAGTSDRWSEQWTDRSGSDELRFGDVIFSELSSQWSAYTAFESVVLSVEEGLPEEDVMSALLAWCRTGGRLVLVGADPWTALASIPDTRRWLLPAYGAYPKGGAGMGSTYHFGQGVLALVVPAMPGAAAMEDSDTGSAIFRAVTDTNQRRWTPGGWEDKRSRMPSVVSELMGFGTLPLRGLMVLLVLFALVMGPVNFLWVKRTKKPMLLLVSVPVIAVVTSVALVLFGIFSQGLDVKASTRSYTFLDQLGRVATTAEVRRIFAGSSPGEGMRPEAGTAVFPGPGAWRVSFRSGKLFTQDLDDGRLLGGDYFPVRRPTTQLLLSDRPSRLRLEVSSTEAGIEVANSLGCLVEQFVLRDVDGRLLRSNAALGPGESQQLTEGVSLYQREVWEEVLKLFWLPSSEIEDLPPGTYLAKVDGTQLRDSCGITVNELSGEHYILGVYALPLGQGPRGGGQ